MFSARKLVLVSVPIVAAFAGLALPAAASPPATATGAFTTSVVSIHEIRTAGGNVFFREVDRDTLTGGLVGTTTDTYTERFSTKNESANAHGIEVCKSCTLGGRTGGYTAVFSFREPAGGASFTGTETFIRGTGGLAGLRGHFSFQGNATGETYSVRYHFEP